MKKLFLVKREVLAESMAKALTTKGTVYEICLASDDQQPHPKKKKIGL